MSTQTSDDFLAQLQELILRSDEFTDFLEGFTGVLANLMPGDMGELSYAVTMLRERRPGTVSASSDRARALDESQTQHPDGPCLTSLREQTLVHVQDTGTETRWPAYMATAAEAEVGSIIAVPFELEGEARAALNVYAGQPNAFDATAIEMIERQTQQATGALRLALRLARLRDTEADLRATLESRTDINLAVGILMGQNGCSQERAVSMLTAASNRRNIKLRQIAADLVASVGGNQAATRFDG
ncbi:RNA-binding protein [Tersicoccus solisilvae]|uniref:RNA-binding protein n=1 Tax=Tersicoccus solisilvae TaxID=1882339 RepID=A0ABQ1NRD4_9MICC|nr:GAF and ANTAR domain-containing protein [Tersicoccus solisilvae]GGC81907.1 RNA-binding protein [Tersicoccus solisilvae]